MPDLENKDNQIGTSDDENKVSESTTETKKQDVQVKDKTEDEKKQSKECKDGDTKSQNESKDEIERTEDEKKQSKECEDVDTKSQNESKDEKESKNEKVNNETPDKLEAPSNKPRKLSDNHAMKGKLDFLLQKHDNELEKKDSSDKDESSHSDVQETSDEDKNDKSDQEESKSVDQSSKKTKTEKKVANESKGKGQYTSSKAETSSTFGDHLLNSLKRPEKYTGILQKKKSSPFWTWKRFFFVLEGKILTFYDSQKDYLDEQKSSKGSIDLNTVVDVKNKKPGLLKSNFPFTLARKSQGPIALATDSSEDRDIWMKRIQDELQRTNHHSSDPVLNKLGGSDEYGRKSATLPPQQRTGSLPTINIQDENSKEEEDIDKKSDVEEEKPVMIAPKKVRGVGVMAFAPMGVIKLKNISKSKIQEKEEKDIFDKQEKLEKVNESLVDNSREKPEQTRVSTSSISIEKVEKDTNSTHTEGNIITDSDKNLQTEVEKKASISPNMIKKSEKEDVSEHDTKTEEESKLISPKKDKGVGIENFTPQIVGSQLKKVSISEPQDNKEIGVDHVASEQKEIDTKADSENNTERKDEEPTLISPKKVKGIGVMNSALQGGGIQLNNSVPSESQEKQETNVCHVDSEQKELEVKSGIIPIKTEKNLVVRKTSINRRRSTSPSIPLSKNVQSVVSKNKDDEDSANDNEKEIHYTDDTIQDDKLEKNTLNEVYKSKDMDTEKAKDFIKTNEESNENNINVENDNTPSKDSFSDVTKQSEIIEESNENKILCENADISSNNPSSDTTKESQTIDEKENKSGSGKFNFFKRKTSNSYDLQSKSEKQKKIEITDLNGEVKTHDKKRRPSAFSKLLQGISRGSKMNLIDDPAMNNESNDNDSTGSKTSLSNLNTVKDEDEQNESVKSSPKTPKICTSIQSNEPTGKVNTEVETDVEESLIVRRDFHIPFDESRYSSYSRNSNKSTENEIPPSVPEKKGVRESSPVHDIPTSNQPISNMNEVIEANNTEDENVNKIDGYLSEEQIELKLAKVERRKLSLVNTGNILLLPQPNRQSNGENEPDIQSSIVSVTSTESDDSLPGKKHCEKVRSASVVSTNNILLQPFPNTQSNGENSQRKCPSYISMTSTESDEPLPITKFCGVSPRSSSDSGGRGTDSDSRHSKDLDSPSLSEFSDPDLKAPLLRPNRPTSLISANRKSLTQPEFTVEEEGPLTPGGTNEVDKMKFELPSKSTEPENSKSECNSEDEQEDYFPVVGGGAIELRKSPSGSDKLLKEKKAGGNLRTSGITSLKAYLDEIEEGTSVPDSRIGINRLGQSIAVEKLKSEIK